MTLPKMPDGYDAKRWPTNPALLLMDASQMVAVPFDIALCPECGGPLHVVANAWDTETGKPHADELQVECVADAMLLETAEEEDWPAWQLREQSHRWWQCDWQPVVDAVREWAPVFEEVG